MCRPSYKQNHLRSVMSPAPRQGTTQTKSLAVGDTRGSAPAYEIVVMLIRASSGCPVDECNTFNKRGMMTKRGGTRTKPKASNRSLEKTCLRKVCRAEPWSTCRKAACRTRCVFRCRSPRCTRPRPQCSRSSRSHACRSLLC